MKSVVGLAFQALKALIVQKKWKEHLFSRSQRQLNANKKFAKYKKKRNAQRSQQTKRQVFRKTGEAIAPEVLSLLANTEETVRFLKGIRTMGRTENVFINLSGVRTITPEAIAALLATIHNPELRSAQIGGNTPMSSVARRVLDESGFRSYVKSSVTIQPRQSMGKVRKRSRSGETSNTDYDQLVADDLISFAMERLNGVPGPHGPSYSIFGEAMLNTLNHASPGDERELWWASVYFDQDRQCCCFTFVDQGVGVFESHQFGFRLQALRYLTLLTHAEILKQLFEGRIASSTRLPGRGHGIPRMYSHSRAGRVQNFFMLTNDAAGWADDDRFLTLSHPFRGTVVYWEVSKECQRS